MGVDPRATAQKVLQLFQLLTSSLRLPQLKDGGHQEEDAGHEGGEGQCLRPGGCQRGEDKAARIRAQKGEDEVEELLIKSRQLETELDVTTERLGIATLHLEKDLKEAREKAEAADTTYDEVAKKLATCESDL